MPKRIKLEFKRLLNKPDMELSLRRLRQNGFKPRRAIDVGAHKGEVTRLIKRTFPEIAVLMIEPCQDVNPYLKKVCKDYPDCQYINALIGATEKEKVNFLINGSHSHVLSHDGNLNQGCAQLPMTTLDKLTGDSPFSKPDFLKLDVQGYELQVLKGAQSVMNTVEVIIMELTLIPNSDSPIFYEALKFMDEQGFRLYDICTFFYRPADNALWQIDAIFIRKTSSLLPTDKRDY